MRKSIFCIALLQALYCAAQPAGPAQKTKSRPASSPVINAGTQPGAGTQPTGSAQPTGGTPTTTSTQAAPASSKNLQGNGAVQSPQQAQLVAQKLSTNFVDHFGGKIYSTGTADIQATIWPSTPGTPPLPSRWIQAHTFVKCGVYLVSPGPERFLGSNIPGGVTTNLGKIPEGELIFVIRTQDGYTLQTGDAQHTPDKLVHAFTRMFPFSGVVQVWFEDAPGPVHTGRNDADFDDVCIQLSGGVADETLMGLTKLAKEQPAKPEKP
jgi:hypothetical protein